MNLKKEMGINKIPEMLYLILIPFLLFSDQGLYNQEKSIELAVKIKKTRLKKRIVSNIQSFYYFVMRLFGSFLKTSKRERLMSNRSLAGIVGYLLFFAGFAAHADICGNLKYDECKQATAAALGARMSPNKMSFAPVYIDKFNSLSWSTSIIDSNGYHELDDNGCGNNFYQEGFNAVKCTIVKGSDGSLQVNVDDSSAAYACKRIGARLPTKLEFQSLIRNFDFVETTPGEPLITNAGASSMSFIFDDMPMSKYPVQQIWTSTVDSNDVTKAFYFETNSGRMLSTPRYNYVGVFGGYVSVRCVTEP